MTYLQLLLILGAAVVFIILLPKVVVYLHRLFNAIDELTKD